MTNKTKFVVGEVVSKENCNYTLTKLLSRRTVGGNLVREYEFVCSVCSEDKELFGETTFKTYVEGLSKINSYSCGCAKNYKYTSEQQAIRVKRILPENKSLLTTLGVSHKSDVEILCLDCGDIRRLPLNSILTGKGVHCLRCEYKQKEFDVDLEWKSIKKDSDDKGYTHLCIITNSHRVRDFKFSFKCTYGHKNYTTVEKYRAKGLFCNRCDVKSKRRSPEGFVEEFKEECNERGVKYIGCANPKTIYDKHFWMCYCGSENSTSFDNFIRGRGCKYCSHTHKKHTSGLFYITFWKNNSSRFIKFGITSRRIKNRVDELCKHNKKCKLYKVLYFKFEIGFESATMSEDFLKVFIKNDRVSSTIFPQGYTEASERISQESIEDVLGYYCALNGVPKPLVIEYQTNKIKENR